jgi:hypothetical protein
MLIAVLENNFLWPPNGAGKPGPYEGNTFKYEYIAPLEKYVNHRGGFEAGKQAHLGTGQKPGPPGERWGRFLEGGRGGPPHRERVAKESLAGLWVPTFKIISGKRGK